MNTLFLKTTTSQDALKQMRSMCVHMLAAGAAHTHMHGRLNDMHILMQAVCNDTQKRMCILCLLTREIIRHYTHTHRSLSCSHTQYIELHSTGS